MMALLALAAAALVLAGCGGGRWHPNAAKALRGAGTQRPNAAVGATGPTGLEGPTGTGVSSGWYGPTGPWGPHAIVPSDGCCGPTGAYGPTGPRGPTGRHGPAEAPDPVGPTGSDGRPTYHFPVLLTAPELEAEAARLGTPIYWVGPRPGYRYELWRASRGYVFVRYLPRGHRASAARASFLTVGTYPFPGAYQALKTQANGKAIAASDGSIYLRLPERLGAGHIPLGKRVLIAFPGVDDQVEIYDPDPLLPARIASSGEIKPVG